jgi:2-polyprenyl-3-methyl-5-hydroxy-6-metoxy-1,4-benzoquinol methylase
MSYKLMTIRTAAAQDALQWSTRSFIDELEVCNNRTLATLFTEFLPHDGLIVEAGAGLGGWVRWLKDKGHSVVGIDCFQPVIDAARKADPTLDMRLGRIEALPFADNSVAAYVSLGVIEHFEHGPEHILKEAFRILRPGGIAIISTPALTPVRRVFTHPLRSAVIAALKLFGKPAHFWEYRFSRTELCKFVSGAGFAIDAVDLDEMIPGPYRHIGMSADFLFLRDSSGAWKLNALGRLVLRMFRSVLPDWYYASANVVIAHKRPVG